MAKAFNRQLLTRDVGDLEQKLVAGIGTSVVGTTAIIAGAQNYFGVTINTPEALVIALLLVAIGGYIKRSSLPAVIKSEAAAVLAPVSASGPVATAAATLGGDIASGDAIKAAALDALKSAGIDLSSSAPAPAAVLPAAAAPVVAAAPVAAPAAAAPAVSSTPAQ